MKLVFIKACSKSKKELMNEDKEEESKNKFRAKVSERAKELIKEGKADKSKDAGIAATREIIEENEKMKAKKIGLSKKSLDSDTGLFFKAKRYGVGETSQKTGLKKVGPNKWVDPKTGKEVKQPDEKKGGKKSILKNAVMKVINMIKQRKEKGGSGVAKDIIEAGAGQMAGESAEQLAGRTEQVGKKVSGTDPLSQVKKKLGIKKKEPEKMKTVDKRKYTETKNAYREAMKGEKKHLAKELMMQLDDTEKKNKLVFSQREKIRNKYNVKKAFVFIVKKDDLVKSKGPWKKGKKETKVEMRFGETNKLKVSELENITGLKTNKFLSLPEQRRDLIERGKKNNKIEVYRKHDPALGEYNTFIKFKK